MLNKVKRFYWKRRKSKGKALLWLFRSISAEIKVRFFYYLFPSSKNQHSLENRTIISLTSYPPRFDKLKLTLMSLLNQDLLPDEIVLWIAANDMQLLPNDIVSLADKTILTIKTCDDFGPGKKILPALIEDSNRNIITADDDIYYPRHWFRALISGWNEDSKTVIAHRVHRIKVNPDDTKPLPYSMWDFDIQDTKPQRLNFATGCGGVFYPAGSLPDESTNFQNYIALCNKQDDIWLYWMERLNETKVVFSGFTIPLIGWLGSEFTSLSSLNLAQGENDKCIKRMMEHYTIEF